VYGDVYGDTYGEPIDDRKLTGGALPVRGTSGAAGGVGTSSVLLDLRLMVVPVPALAALLMVALSSVFGATAASADEVRLVASFAAWRPPCSAA
jgi:hypothetical protein